MSDTIPYMDRDDAMAYIMRYPVVMLEETSGIPVDGNFNEIYQNAMSTGLRNNRNIKKGPDVKSNDIFNWHEANYGFETNGDALEPEVACIDRVRKGGICLKNSCQKFLSNYLQTSIENINAVSKNLNGPNNFSELATLWYTYQKRYTENKNWVPLFIRLKLNGNDPMHIKERGTFEKLAEGQYQCNQTGIDRTIYRFQVVFSLKNYVSVGDIFSEAEKLGSSVSVLFAHDSICRSNDVPNLYVKLGQSYDTNHLPLLKDSRGFLLSSQKGESKPIYVLRTALFKTFTNQTLPGIDYTYKVIGNYYNTPPQCEITTTAPLKFRRSIFYNVSNVLVNIDYGNNYYYTLLTNPKTIFDDLVSALMRSQGDVTNISWKGLDSQDNSQRGARFQFFSALCKLSPNLPAYPSLCECLGNGNEEAEFKKLNRQFSMFCHSKKCYDANYNDPDTFKYRPDQEPICPSITMCNISLKGNVFRYVNIDNTSCSQVINTSSSSLSGATGSAITIRSHNVICFTAVVLFIVFAFIVLIFKINKNTV